MRTQDLTHTPARLAYNNDPSRKAAILDIAVDNLVKDSHQAAANLVGMPIELAGLFNAILEGLPNGKAQAWPVDFLDAIAPGADLTLIWPRWAHWLLTTEVAKAAAKNSACAKAVADVAALFAKWIDTDKKPSAERWDRAAKATCVRTASDARRAAGAAARAASATWASGAARAAWTSAWAARAASATARIASDASAAKVARAARAARAASYQRQAAQLLTLLRAAPGVQICPNNPHLGEKK